MCVYHTSKFSIVRCLNGNCLFYFVSWKLLSYVNICKYWWELRLKSERGIWINHLRNFFDRLRALALKQVHVQKAKRGLLVRKKEGNYPGKWRKLQDILIIKLTTQKRNQFYPWRSLIVWKLFGFFCFCDYCIPRPKMQTGRTG